MSNFILHPRLDKDTAFIADWTLCRVLLMNDSRFPWVVLVPRVADVSEIFELGEETAALAMSEINRAGSALKTWAQADKINVGALGNIVPQLHFHVVARKTNDAAWPEPVWGAGVPQPYQDLNKTALEFRDAF